MNKKIWDRISHIQSLDKRSINGDKRILKLTKEVGDLADLQYQSTGFKPMQEGMTQGLIIKGKAKKIADILIVALNYAKSINMTYEEMIKITHSKIDKLEDYANNSDTLDGSIPKAKVPFQNTIKGQPVSKEYPKADESVGKQS